MDIKHIRKVIKDLQYAQHNVSSAEILSVLGEIVDAIEELHGKTKLMPSQYRFKKCACPLEAWERIVVSGDDEFGGRTTIHHHCSKCGEDFAVTDFDTGEVLIGFINE